MTIMRLLMKKLVPIFYIAIFFIAFTTSAFSAQILLKGKVTDAYTGKPMGVTMRFETKDGKIFKIKSDPVSGEYSQLFNSSTEYEVTFIHKEIVRKKETFTTKESNDYKEFDRDFTVQRLAKDLLFMDINVFETGSANISGSFNSKLEELQDVMKFNRNVKFYFVVSLNDIAEKDRSAKSSLLAQREAALKDKVKALGKDASRIQIKTENNCKKSTNNLAVIVKSIESILK